MNLPPKVLKQRLRINEPPAHGNTSSRTNGTSAGNPQGAHASTNNLKFINVPMAQAETPDGKPDPSIARTVSHAIQESTESLPVLAAFQEFLELERTRTRKRLFVLSLSYLFILALTISAGLLGGMVIIKRFNANIQKVESDFLLVQSDVAKLQAQSLKSRTDTDTLSARLSAETMKIRTDTESSSDEARKKILNQVNTQDELISKINETITSLQKENGTLRDSLTTMQTRWMSMTNELMVSLLQSRDIRTQETRETESPRRMASASSSISMFITPPGQNRPVDWRIPIPE